MVVSDTNRTSIKMENTENLEELKKKQLAIALSACEASEKYSCRLKIILHHLKEASENIIEHVSKGDIHNQQRNSELWHRLYNVEHQVKQFTRYTESSTEDFYKASEELIQTLIEIRPPKE